MWVIEAVNGDGEVQDVYVSDRMFGDDLTLMHPLKYHFQSGRVMPWAASAYETPDDAAADLPKAINEWGRPAYWQHHGAVVSARIVALNPESAECGYIIRGSTDEDVAGVHYPMYDLAAKALRLLLRKKMKNRVRGEYPHITWPDGGIG